METGGEIYTSPHIGRDFGKSINFFEIVCISAEISAENMQIGGRFIFFFVSFSSFLSVSFAYVKIEFSICSVNSTC